MAAGSSENMAQVIGMTANPIVARVWQVAEPLCQSEGVELVHVEYQREPGGRTLRVYLDKPGGITLDDCAHVSRQLGDMLDVALDVEEPYRMEVSSPGMSRPLGRISDFERFRGRRAKIKTARVIDGQKNFTGTLEGVDGLAVQLKVKDQTRRIVFADIVKAHLLQHNGENAC